MEVLVVREESVGLGSVEVVVPNPDHSQQNRQVLLEGRSLEMLVHAVRTLEERLEVLEPDDEGDGETDGRPQTVPTADPVPELEHVGLGDAERGDGGGVGGERDEVLGDVRLVLRRLEEPVARARGVRDGLLRGERLAGNDEQGGFGVAQEEGLGDMGTVDVRDEVGGQVALGVGLEGFGDHDGTQVGSTDTDVDDGGDGLAGVPLPRTAPDGVGELLDVGKDTGDLVGTRLGDRELAVDVAESDVKHGTVFGSVDVLSREHLVAEGLDLRLTDEIEEGPENGLGDEVLGEIEEEGDVGIVRGDILPMELVESFRILSEQVLQDELGVLGVVDRLELLPGGII